MKKQPIELIPGLRIGVGVGRLILSHSARKEDGLEMWAVNYQLNIDGPIRETFYMSSQIIRELLKVEPLERDYKSAYEHGRRLKIRKEELESQLAKSENLRDVAQKTNKQRIDELEARNAEMDLKIKAQYNELVKRNSEITLQFLNSEKEAEKVKSDFQASEFVAESLSKTLDHQRSWTFGLAATTLLFFALWIAAMYF